MSLLAVLRGRGIILNCFSIKVVCVVFTSCYLHVALSAVSAQNYIYHFTNETTTTHKLACETDWTLYRDSNTCFKVMERAMLTWGDARQNCNSMGADLAVMADEDTYTFIQELTARLATGNEYWIGLYTTASDIFFWISGVQSTAIPGYMPTLKLQENRCFAIDGATLLPSDCSRKTRFICEKGPSSVIPVEAYSCPNEWHQYLAQQTCFRIPGGSSNWEDARRSCQAFGGDLGKVTDQNAEDFIRERIIGGENGRYWIGLIRRTGSSIDRWLDIEEYDNWHHIFNEKNKQSKDLCVWFKRQANPVHTNDWGMTYCTENRKMLCQRHRIVTSEYNVPSENLVNSHRKTISRVSLTCPGNWTLWGEGKTCVAYFHLEESHKDASSAATHCSEEGGHLAKLSSQTINEAFADFRHPNFVEYWLGMKMLNIREALWYDLTAVTYSNWAAGESGGVGCAYMEATSNKWRIGDCQEKRAYICQIDQAKETLKTVKEWTVNGDSIYISTTKTSSHFVQEDCEALGLTELFLESDDEFLQLTAWLGRNYQAFTENIWIKTTKLDFDDYRWANDSNRVGETGIWKHDSTGFPCYQKHGLHVCCTLVTSGDGDPEELHLEEMECTHDAMFICVDHVSPLPTTTLPITQSTSTRAELSSTATTSSLSPTRSASSSSAAHPTSSVSIESISTFTLTTASHYSTPSLLSPGDRETITESKTLSIFPSTTESNSLSTSKLLTHTSESFSSLHSSTTSTTVSESMTAPIATSTTIFTSTATPSLPPTTVSISKESPGTISTTASGTQWREVSISTTISSSTFGISSETILTSSSLISSSTTSSSFSTQSNLASVSLPPLTFLEQSTAPTTSPYIEITTEAPLPPLPPSKPLTEDEKEAFKESLSLLESVLSEFESNTDKENNTLVVNKLCPCACSVFKFSGMPSPRDLANMVGKIQAALRVEVTTLSSSKNKKTSAKDDRPSSQSIAVVAVIFGSIPFIMVIGVDILRVYQHFQTKKKKPKTIQIEVTDVDAVDPYDSMTIASDLSSDSQDNYVDSFLKDPLSTE